MILHAVGGLCNRLRAILGHLQAHGPIEVRWDTDDPAISFEHFYKVFERVDGLTFTKNSPTWDVEAWAPPVGVKCNWSLLRPDKAVLDRVAELRAQIGAPYAAMHIRRTDHRVHAERFGVYTDDDEFREWACHFEHLYLATDNGETQRLFPRATVNRSFTNPAHQHENDRAKAGSLADAVVDLYMCVYAEHFKGSGYSTFSETIQEMRAPR
jgi:hypothetical protein